MGRSDLADITAEQMEQHLSDPSTVQQLILSYQEVKKHHYGWDTMDFNDNVRKDFNYGQE